MLFYNTKFGLKAIVRLTVYPSSYHACSIRIEESRLYDVADY